MNNINCVLKDKRGCFGCRACVNACPKGCIEMKTDPDEGFFYPYVDESKCCDCGICKKSCPSLNTSAIYKQNSKTPLCLAVAANDDIRLQSSSGGAFSLFANKILDLGGVVCGAAYDGGSEVKHILVDNKNDLARLRGSKYLQSNTNTVYSQIKKLLKEGRIVLFSGTPCQVAGLNIFLGKPHDNLYTIDILCHGVPPQKVFDQYLTEIGAKQGFINAKFRDKIKWWDVYLSTTTEVGTQGYARGRDTYLHAFLRNMCLRPSCSICPYTRIPRESDVTMGDFWKINRYDPKLNDYFGLSAVFINSERGRKLFESLSQEDFKIKQEVPLKHVHFVTLQKPLPQHPNRASFFRLIKEGKSLGETVSYCLNNQYDCILFAPTLCEDYGELMATASLFRVIRSLGYTSIIAYAGKIFNNEYVVKFIKNNLRLTHKSFTEAKEADELNKLSKTVVVNSSRAWSPLLNKDTNSLIPLANTTSKKISYGASFGFNEFVNSNFIADDEQFLLYKYYLSKFDKISLQEERGINILKDSFQLEGNLVLDPILLLDKTYYIKKFARKRPKNITDNTVLLYMVSQAMHPEQLKWIDSQSYSNIVKYSKTVSTSVEDWVASIYYSKLFITDSFHGICMALCLNKDFICINHSMLGSSQMLSLLTRLGVQHRLVGRLSEIDRNSALEKPIDWSYVNSILQTERDRSIQWLKAALNAPKEKVIDERDTIIKFLYNEISSLKSEKNEALEKAQATSGEFMDVKVKGSDILNGCVAMIDYHKNCRKYLLYRLLRVFTFGRLGEKIYYKMKFYRAKMKAVDRLRKGIAMMSKNDN